MWGRANDFEDGRPGGWATAAPLPAVDAVRALARRRPTPDHPERRSRLEQVTRGVGAEDLWTFTPVEDDLFLRDCVGAVPGSDEITTVTAARRREHGFVLRETTHTRRILVFRPRAGAGPVLAVTFPRGRAAPGLRALELLACLRDALAAAEVLPGAPGPAPAETGEEVPELLRRRLDELERSWIHHAVATTGGDRAAAAAELGVSEGELVARMARLGHS